MSKSIHRVPDERKGGSGGIHKEETECCNCEGGACNWRSNTTARSKEWTDERKPNP